MSKMTGVSDEGSRSWHAARAVGLLVGSFVAAVGVVAATASLVAGFGLEKPGALKVAALVGGTLLLVAFLAQFGRPTTADRWSLAGIGTVFAVGGLALFWTTLPVGWAGDPTKLPTVAIGAYVAGIIAVYGAGVTTQCEDQTGESAPTENESEGFASVESVVSPDDRES